MAVRRSAKCGTAPNKIIQHPKKPGPELRIRPLFIMLFQARSGPTKPLSTHPIARTPQALGSGVK
eukprot:10224245-Alexandrium_andersonii.AAC.1